MTLERPDPKGAEAVRDLPFDVGNSLAETEQVLDGYAGMAEARVRSSKANFLVSCAALLMAIAPRFPYGAMLFGSVTVLETSAIAGLSWLTFQAATLACKGLSPQHSVTRALSTLDAVVRHAGILTLIWRSGSASSPLWVLAMSDAFVWRYKDPRRMMVDGALTALPYVVLAMAFFVTHRAGDGSLTMLVLLASMTGYTLTGRMAAQSGQVHAEHEVIERKLRALELRNDRERMARELHDGVGADVMALILRLRRAARNGHDPHAARLAERAGALHDELRTVVWSLRNEQGTLAELGKLIDAAWRGVRAELTCVRNTPLAAAQARVGPSAAVAALTTARELVRHATRRGAKHAALNLEAETVLYLSLEDDGTPCGPDDIEHLRKSIERDIDPIAAPIRVEHRPPGVHIIIETPV